MSERPADGADRFPLVDPTALRIGFGFDIHRLVPDRRLMLGCVEIPFHLGLIGHSDGDAVAHALSDALLGACGLGDIGVRFPPSDPRWEGVPGAEILARTRQLCADAGARILQADITIVAEAPRILPHRERMAGAISQALDCPAERVAIKARTHEGLGEIGRGEAISCYALALVVMLPG